MLDSDTRDELTERIERAQISAIHRALDQAWALGHEDRNIQDQQQKVGAMEGQALTLEQELRKALRQINSQIEEIRQEAVRTHTPPVTMKDSHGDYIWSPLVVAKAQVLHGLVLLNAQDVET